jgi:hypothetical protein
MVTVEAAAIQLGRAIAVPAVSAWIRGRRNRRNQNASLAELIDDSFKGHFARRSASRKIEEITDSLAEQLAPILADNGPALPRNETQAVVDAVISSVQQVDLSDDGLFAANLDATRIAAAVMKRASQVGERYGLSSGGQQLYHALVLSCVQALTRLVIQSDQFQARAGAETLQRLSTLLDLTKELHTLIARPSLDAPEGVEHDSEFEGRYREHLKKTLDDLELFGIDTRNYRPRTTLSVAYISLSVTSSVSEDLRSSKQTVATWRRLAWPDEKINAKDAATTRVEEALRRGHRTLIRGEAGSGKTTLLRWLAVTAARNGFESSLIEWNGLLPFIVKLRSYAGTQLPPTDGFLAFTAPTLVGIMPQAWVHRVLASGRGLLLVDGVDELRVTERPKVRTWIRGLLAEYPNLRIVVTSRPAAAAGKWLDGESFESAILERMTPADVQALIEHWHEAVRDAGNLPCSESELPKYKSALLARLDANSHLRALATSPLLCAMLCALNLDRDTQLPRDRMGLYQAAVELLLERRDTERQIPDSNIGLSARDKLQLLQTLAYWLSLNGRSEMTSDLAIGRLEAKIASMPQVPHTPVAVLDHLLQRSGVIRQPTVDRIDFVHRTFQEYLTAREIAEQSHVGLLLERAHLDSWRDVVIMAAGHGNAWVRREIVSGLLDGVDSKPTKGRTLLLLAASCLETVPAVEPPALLARLEQSLSTLLPPRRPVEARSLAMVGEPLIARLPSKTSVLSDSVARACIRTAALVNGASALEYIAAAGQHDLRADLQSDLLAFWRYFDPEEYVEKVLIKVPQWNVPIRCGNLVTLRYAGRLTKALRVDVDIEGSLDLATLKAVPNLTSLWIDGTFVGPLGALAAHKTTLHTLGLLSDRSIERSGKVFNALTQLRSVSLYNVRLDSFQPLRALGELLSIYLFPFDPSNVDLLASLPKLRSLSLGSLRDIDFSPFAPNASIETLTLFGGGRPRGGLRALSEFLPGLRSLSILTGSAAKWSDDWRILSEFKSLLLLTLGVSPSREKLEQIVESAPFLSNLTLDNADDLRPLNGLRHLHTLELRWVDSPLDLSPLATTNVRRIFIETLDERLILGKEGLPRSMQVVVHETKLSDDVG